jgi:hypothetical protein
MLHHSFDTNRIYDVNADSSRQWLSFTACHHKFKIHGWQSPNLCYNEAVRIFAGQTGEYLPFETAAGRMRYQ